MWPRSRTQHLSCDLDHPTSSLKQLQFRSDDLVPIHRLSTLPHNCEISINTFLSTNVIFLRVRNCLPCPQFDRVARTPVAHESHEMILTMRDDALCTKISNSAVLMGEHSDACQCSRWVLYYAKLVVIEVTKLTSWWSGQGQWGPWLQSWQWPRLAGLGQARRRCDTHCPCCCQTSWPQSQIWCHCNINNIRYCHKAKYGATAT